MGITPQLRRVSRVPALLEGEVVHGEEELSDGLPVVVEKDFVGLHQYRLAHRRGGLELVDLLGPLRVPHLAEAGPDGTRAHQDGGPPPLLLPHQHAHQVRHLPDVKLGAVVGEAAIRLLQGTHTIKLLSIHQNHPKA
jgi:hypothetical protein